MNSSRSLVIERFILGLFLMGGLATVLAFAAGAVAWSVTRVDGSANWTHSALPTPPEKAVEIAYIRYHSLGDDPTGDIIYVSTVDQQVLSYKLFNGRWSSVKAIARSDFEYEDIYAPDWIPPSDSPLWDKAPVEGEVQDASGTYFEHAVGGVMRCYILYPDGTLEVWTRLDFSDGGVITGRLAISYLVAAGIFLVTFSVGTILAVRRLVRKLEAINQA